MRTLEKSSLWASVRASGFEFSGWVVREVPLMRSELTGMELTGVGLVNNVRGWQIGSVVDALGVSSTIRIRVSALRNSVRSQHN